MKLLINWKRCNKKEVKQEAPAGSVINENELMTSPRKKNTSSGRRKLRSDPGNGGGKHGGDQVEVEESKDTRESRVSFFFFSEGGESKKGRTNRGSW